MNKNEVLINELITAIKQELDFAMNKFDIQNSMHEGYAILLEEVDELWAEIKKKNMNKQKVYEEAIQVASMAIRLLHDSIERGDK